MWRSKLVNIDYIKIKHRALILKVARYDQRQFTSTCKLQTALFLTQTATEVCGPLSLNIVPLETDIHCLAVVLANSQHKMLFFKKNVVKLLKHCLFYLIQVGVACNIIPPLLCVNKGLALVCWLLHLPLDRFLFD